MTPAPETTVSFNAFCKLACIYEPRWDFWHYVRQKKRLDGELPESQWQMLWDHYNKALDLADLRATEAAARR